MQFDENNNNSASSRRGNEETTTDLLRRLADFTFRHHQDKVQLQMLEIAQQKQQYRIEVLESYLAACSKRGIQWWTPATAAAPAATTSNFMLSNNSFSGTSAASKMSMSSPSATTTSPSLGSGSTPAAAHQLHHHNPYDHAAPLPYPPLHHIGEGGQVALGGSTAHSAVAAADANTFDSSASGYTNTGAAAAVQPQPPPSPAPRNRLARSLSVVTTASDAAAIDQSVLLRRNDAMQDDIRKNVVSHQHSEAQHGRRERQLEMENETLRKRVAELELERTSLSGRVASMVLTQHQATNLHNLLSRVRSQRATRNSCLLRLEAAERDRMASHDDLSHVMRHDSFHRELLAHRPMQQQQQQQPSSALTYEERKRQEQRATLSLTAPAFRVTGRNAATGSSSVALVFTDMMFFVAMAEQYPSFAAFVTKQYRDVVRQCAILAGGYEAHRQRSEILLHTFSSVVDAALFAAEVQLRMVKQVWPETILRDPRFDMVRSGNNSSSSNSAALLFCGPRVRSGVHVAEALSTEYDETTCSMRYEGEGVHIAAMAAARARPGEILATPEFVYKLREALFGIAAAGAGGASSSSGDMGTTAACSVNISPSLATPSAVAAFAASFSASWNNDMAMSLNPKYRDNIFSIYNSNNTNIAAPHSALGNFFVPNMWCGPPCASGVPPVKSNFISLVPPALTDRRAYWASQPWCGSLEELCRASPEFASKLREPLHWTKARGFHPAHLPRFVVNGSKSHKNLTLLELKKLRHSQQQDSSSAPLANSSSSSTGWTPLDEADVQCHKLRMAASKQHFVATLAQRSLEGIERDKMWEHDLFERAAEKPPEGTVGIAFVRIHRQDKIANEINAEVTNEAVRNYHAQIRMAVRRNQGYLAKREGEVMMIVFPSLAFMLAFSAQLHTGMLSAVEWHSEFDLHQATSTEYVEDYLSTGAGYGGSGSNNTALSVSTRRGTPFLAGLRVCVAMNLVTPVCERDPASLRMEYLGPSVQVLSQTVLHARGGETLLGEDGYQAARTAGLFGDRSPYIVVPRGLKAIPGVKRPEMVYAVLPRQLSARFVYWQRSEHDEAAGVQWKPRTQLQLQLQHSSSSHHLQQDAVGSGGGGGGNRATTSQGARRLSPTQQQQTRDANGRLVPSRPLTSSRFGGTSPSRSSSNNSRALVSAGGIRGGSGSSRAGSGYNRRGGAGGGAGGKDHHHHHHGELGAAQLRELTTDMHVVASVPSDTQHLSLRMQKLLTHYNESGTANVAAEHAGTLRSVRKLRKEQRALEAAYAAAETASMAQHDDSGLVADVPHLGRAALVLLDAPGLDKLASAVGDQIKIRTFILYRQVINDKCDLFDGYRVKHNGEDGFLLAFRDVATALHFCMAVQVALLHVTWPADLTRFDPTLRVRETTHLSILSSKHTTALAIAQAAASAAAAKQGGKGSSTFYRQVGATSNQLASALTAPPIAVAVASGAVPAPPGGHSLKKPTQQQLNQQQQQQQHPASAAAVASPPSASLSATGGALATTAITLHQLLFNGVRCRAGIAVGDVHTQFDPFTRRTDYSSGPVAFMAYRVSQAAFPGEVCLSCDAMKELYRVDLLSSGSVLRNYNIAAKSHVHTNVDEGIPTVSGEAARIYSVLPISLMGRLTKFPTAASSSGANNSSSGSGGGGSSSNNSNKHSSNKKGGAGGRGGRSGGGSAATGDDSGHQITTFRRRVTMEEVLQLTRDMWWRQVAHLTTPIVIAKLRRSRSLVLQASGGGLVVVDSAFAAAEKKAIASAQYMLGLDVNGNPLISLTTLGNSSPTAWPLDNNTALLGAAAAAAAHGGSNSNSNNNRDGKAAMAAAAASGDASLENTLRSGGLSPNAAPGFVGSSSPAGAQLLMSSLAGPADVEALVLPLEEMCRTVANRVELIAEIAFGPEGHPVDGFSPMKVSHELGNAAVFLRNLLFALVRCGVFRSKLVTANLIALSESVETSYAAIVSSAHAAAVATGSGGVAGGYASGSSSSAAASFFGSSLSSLQQSWSATHLLDLHDNPIRRLMADAALTRGGATCAACGLNFITYPFCARTGAKHERTSRFFGYNTKKTSLHLPVANDVRRLLDDVAAVDDDGDGRITLQQLQMMLAWNGEYIDEVTFSAIAAEGAAHALREREQQIKMLLERRKKQEEDRRAAALLKKDAKSMESAGGGSGGGGNTAAGGGGSGGVGGGGGADGIHEMTPALPRPSSAIGGSSKADASLSGVATAPAAATSASSPSGVDGGASNAGNTNTNSASGSAQPGSPTAATAPSSPTAARSGRPHHARSSGKQQDRMSTAPLSSAGATRGGAMTGTSAGLTSRRSQKRHDEDALLRQLRSGTGELMSTQLAMTVGAADLLRVLYPHVPESGIRIMLEEVRARTPGGDDDDDDDDDDTDDEDDEDEALEDDEVGLLEITARAAVDSPTSRKSAAAAAATLAVAATQEEQEQQQQQQKRNLPTLAPQDLSQPALQQQQQQQQQQQPNVEAAFAAAVAGTTGSNEFVSSGASSYK